MEHDIEEGFFDDWPDDLCAQYGLKKSSKHVNKDQLLIHTTPPKQEINKEEVQNNQKEASNTPQKLDSPAHIQSDEELTVKKSQSQQVLENVK